MKPPPGAVRLSGRLICGSEREAAILREQLLEHVRLSRAEPGCLTFDVSGDVSGTEDPLVWRVEECFRDRAAFEHHQQRTRASPWWSATRSIRREYEVTGPD